MGRESMKKMMPLKKKEEKDDDNDDVRPERLGEQSMEKQKLQALEREIRESRTKEKMLLRRENAEYVGNHPEIGSLLRQFLTLVYKEKPDDVMDLAVRFFCQVDLRGNTLKRDKARAYEHEDEEEEEEEVG
jgi:hypothetical protein